MSARQWTILHSAAVAKRTPTERPAAILSLLLAAAAEADSDAELGQAVRAVLDAEERLAEEESAAFAATLDRVAREQGEGGGFR